MPTYEFRCPLGHDFENFYRSIGAAPAEVACPVCGKIAERQLSAGAGLVFKGSGFYITDYGKDGKKSQTPPPAKEGAAASSGGDSSASSGGDSASKGESTAKTEAAGGQSKSSDGKTSSEGKTSSSPKPAAEKPSSRRAKDSE
jgi:putative FmdB family regulatory protein